MWLGANMTAAIVGRIERLITPLDRNRSEGMMDSASARKTLLFLKHTIQIRQ